MNAQKHREVRGTQILLTYSAQLLPRTIRPPKKNKKSLPECLIPNLVVVYM